MSVIKARTRGKHVVRHITRLDQESLETLFAYAAFLGEPPEYVLTQLIDSVLAKDREFLAWRDTHGGSHVPRSLTKTTRARDHRGTAPSALFDHATPDRPSSSLAS